MVFPLALVLTPKDRNAYHIFIGRIRVVIERGHFHVPSFKIQESLRIEEIASISGSPFGG